MRPSPSLFPSLNFVGGDFMPLLAICGRIFKTGSEQGKSRFSTHGGGVCLRWAQGAIIPIIVMAMVCLGRGSVLGASSESRLLRRICRLLDSAKLARLMLIAQAELERITSRSWLAKLAGTGDATTRS